MANLAPDQEELTIVSGGMTLDGWEEFRVSRSVEQCAAVIQVGMSERYPLDLQNTTFEPFNPLVAYLSGDLILTGYVDRYMPSYDARNHPVVMAGRSKTEDLLDCSVDIDNLGGVGIPAWAVVAPTIGVAAERICTPYGITVTGDGMSAPLDATYPVPVNPGMTCWQLLEELARVAQVLIWDNPQGQLVLSKVGTTRAATALVEGVNCEIAEAAFTADQRYSDIWVVSSAPSLTNLGHVSFFARKHDSAVPRKRILMIVMDNLGLDGSNAPQRRADWEIARRYGRSRQVIITVTGWRDGSGTLWTPNTLVSINAPRLKIKEDWLITQCDWSRGQRGTLTALHCMPPQGVTPEPFVPVLPIPGIIPAQQ